MKRRIQSWFMFFLALIIFVSFSLPAQAKTYDVTKQKKKEIGIMLDDTVEFLVLYATYHNKPEKLKLTNRQKTNLVCFGTQKFSKYHFHVIYKNGEFMYKFTASKNQINNQLKNVFGSKAKFDLAKSSGSKIKRDLTNMYWIKGNSIYHHPGEWGDQRPVGKVSKVYQISDDTYRVKYITYLYTSEGAYKTAEYSIRLKANKKSKYKYNIVEIELVKNYCLR